LEEAQEELRVATAERDAARNNAAAFQQQLHAVNTQLTDALRIGAAQAQSGGGGGGDGDGDGNGSGGYSNVPEFDGSHPDEIRTWILLLRNKLAAQANRYPTESSKLRYAFGRLQGDAFDMVRSHMSEDTGAISLGSLNELLAVLRQAYDDPDRAHTARIAARTLKMRPLQFSTYLAACKERVREILGEVSRKNGCRGIPRGICVYRSIPRKARTRTRGYISRE
jgi:hypothetical protein